MRKRHRLNPYLTWAQVKNMTRQAEQTLKNNLPVAPQDEAGLTKTFQTWPRGWFHIPKDPDFPVPS